MNLSNQGKLDWLGEEVGAMGPNLHTALFDMVEDGGAIPLPEYITIKREGGQVCLGPSLTQYGRTTARVEVVGEGDRRVVRALVRCQDIGSEEDSGFETEEEEFERMVEKRREELSDEEREIEELDDEAEEVEAKVEEERKVKLEKEEEEGGAEARRKMVHQRRLSAGVSPYF